MGVWNAPPRAFERLLEAIAGNLPLLALPTATPRRALRPGAARVLGDIVAQLERWLGEVRAGRAAASYFVDLTSGATTLAGAVLYAAGAEHAAWRRWTALAAAAHALVGECDSALTLGAIAHEWRLVDALSMPRCEVDASWAVLRMLLGKADGGAPLAVRDEADTLAAWEALLAAVPRSSAELATAFSALVELAVAQDGRVTADAVTLAVNDDPDELHSTAWTPHSVSGGVAAVAAALVRRGAFPLNELAPDCARYAEPGWASGPSDVDVLALLGG